MTLQPGTATPLDDKDDSTGPRPWVSIIVVNYNAGHFLQKALDKVATQTDTDYELILVDNASTDGSLGDLKTEHLQSFRLIALDENTGFAKGNNLAAKQARGEWIALLNPDTEAKPDWLAAFKAATQAHPDTKMFAGATINTSNPEIMDGAGDCYRFLGVPWRGGYSRPIGEMPGIGECFSACTTSVASPFSVRHGTRNRLWTFVKNMPPLALIILSPLHILLSFAFIARAFMKGRGKPTLLGFIDGIKGLGPVWKDRKRVQARRKLNSWQICSQMSWNIALMLTRRSDVRKL